MAPEAIVHAPERQLSQVFFVIIENALIAMRGKGTLTLATQEIAGHDQSFVEVEISDDGPGIPDNKKGKLFKGKLDETSKSSGIGLMWAYAFIRSYGGTIQCQSATGVGTTMLVRVPKDFTISRKDLVIDTQEPDGKVSEDHLKREGVSRHAA